MAVISKAELVEIFGVDDSTIDAWVGDGLPLAGRDRFDDAVVEQWLLDTGRAGRTSAPVLPESAGVLRTKAEVAKFFDVALRTVGEWLNEETFPGQSGSPGKRDGNFPIKEMVEWKKREKLRPSRISIAKSIRRSRNCSASSLLRLD